MVENFCLFFALACSSRHSAFLSLLSLESSLLVVLWELDGLVDCELATLRFDGLCGRRLFGTCCLAQYFQLVGPLLSVECSSVVLWPFLLVCVLL